MKKWYKLWSMKKWYKNSVSGRTNFILGFAIAALLFSGSAFAINTYTSDNTPENGYLLCANKSTKVVTFPNKLNCPSGTIALDLGAVTGVEGPEGPQGPEGPEGPRGLTGSASSESTNSSYFLQVVSQDVIADGVTSGSNLKKFIAAKIGPNAMPFAAYSLAAHLSGNWADSALSQSSKPFIQCYFQYAKDYPDGSYRYGSGRAELSNWSGIAFTTFGDYWATASTDDSIYLVCKTSGSIKGLQGSISAYPYYLMRKANLSN